MNEPQKQNYNQTEVTHIRKYMDIIKTKLFLNEAIKTASNISNR